MKFIVKKLFFIFSVLTLSNQIATALPLDENVQKIYQSIREDIQLKQDASSLAEYQSASQLHKIIATSPFESTCFSLELLKNQELALLEEEIIEHSDDHFCFETSINRISEFHENERIRFLTLFPTFDNSLNLELFADESPLKTTEMEISPKDQKQLIYSFGKAKTHWINLSFDDGPHATRSERLLSILDAEKIKANYFHIGNNAKRLPQLSTKIAQAGHWVGSHSMSHGLSMPQVLTQKGQAGINVEIFNAHQLVQSHLPNEMKNPFFRFPYGAFNQTLINQLGNKSMIGFQWNMDTRDWAITDPVKLFENVMKELNRDQGGLMLFHEIHEQTLTVLPRLFDELKKRSYKTFAFKPKAEALP